MNRLVGNLLDMARLESGMIQLKYEWCDLQEIVGVALRRLHDLLKTRNVVTRIPPDLPLVKGDFALIELVLVNLLDNAYKYSDNNSEIGIDIIRQDKEIWVSILSKGKQIPAHERDKVFDKFYRLSSSRPIVGTGLGLSICKGIIEAHEGKIWVETNSAGANVFTFSLPLDKEVYPHIPFEGVAGNESG